MKLKTIPAGHFHCDGGALFGVVPKKLWAKAYPADAENFTQLTLRCLLVETGTRKILIETGIGNHYPIKHLQNNGVTAVGEIEKSLAQNGCPAAEITDVFFTHLHWDHCTGAVKNENGKLKPVFENARYWCSKTQWEHAKNPNPREKAAFNTRVLDFLFRSGQLNFVEKEGPLFTNFEVRFFDGHTPGQMIPMIHFGTKTLVYMSDLIPTAANIPLLWIAAYDLFPVTVMAEKAKFLDEAAEKNYILFFEHDFYTECATVEFSEKGVVLKEKSKLAEHF